MRQPIADVKDGYRFRADLGVTQDQRRIGDRDQRSRQIGPVQSAPGQTVADDPATKSSQPTRAGPIIEAGAEPVQSGARRRHHPAQGGPHVPAGPALVELNVLGT